MNECDDGNKQPRMGIRNCIALHYIALHCIVLHCILAAWSWLKPLREQSNVVSEPCRITNSERWCDECNQMQAHRNHGSNSRITASEMGRHQAVHLRDVDCCFVEGLIPSIWMLVNKADWSKLRSGLAWIKLGLGRSHQIRRCYWAGGRWHHLKRVEGMSFNALFYEHDNVMEKKLIHMIEHKMNKKYTSEGFSGMWKCTLTIGASVDQFQCMLIG